MSILVEKPGLQTLIQGARRRGFRHLGVPWSGAADGLSLALANRLVGNALDAPGLEVTLSGIELRFDASARVAVTGAPCSVHVDQRLLGMHRRVDVPAGSALRLGAAEKGVRSYLAVSGGLSGEEAMGSVSTYYPAGIGGYLGRALKPGDTLELTEASVDDGEPRTPDEYLLRFTDVWTLRATRGAECGRLVDDTDSVLFGGRFRISARNDRMGTELSGPRLRVATSGELDSRPVFPGTVQCPGSGEPFILGADAQTTGGYARVAEVIRADRHLVGQLRAGNSLRFLERDTSQAADELEGVHQFWSRWLSGIEAII